LGSEYSHILHSKCSPELTDPFNGWLSRYKILSKGYVVYSIGPDTTDGGGMEQSPSKDKHKDLLDITFVVDR
jgi:hypothetical protein